MNCRQSSAMAPKFNPVNHVKEGTRARHRIRGQTWPDFRLASGAPKETTLERDLKATGVIV